MNAKDLQAPHPLGGLLLGVLAVSMFGATLPVTRWTLSPAVSPLFLTAARAVLAAAVSVLFLLATRAAWPERRDWVPLVVASAGNALLYPLSLALALQTQSAAHVAVITALLPLSTAAAAALASRSSRAPLRFWVCAVASLVLVLWFSLRRLQGAFEPVWDDAIVALGVVSASIGYICGAQVTARMGAERTICWVTLLTLPVSIPLTVLGMPEQGLQLQEWGGLCWLALVSMWGAFFAWYRALHWGGPLQVSQTQALQPFFSIALAWPLLGERPDLATLGFAAAVVALVWLGKRA